MANLDQIMDYLCPEEISVTVTPTTGVFKSITIHKLGNMIIMSTVFQTSGSVAAGSNLFVCDLPSAYYPKSTVTSAGFYGSNSVSVQYNTEGRLLIRNTGSSSLSITGANTATISITFAI